ncbi:hypothetical protein [Acetobacterium woodii]|uniref:Uncharacterized protein n=1 Tax=Acetobacterium woodii (strain ATCC 29683 / DSM 1030 / JCM 2381 / KCTC 1655 / WB1) TaxID=931626 RepID=H6LDV1_ACEWD|nr:hypothetical protein [Acetobacterium woodii]AFA47994.1 hypothetical protein Awo_c12100 [Acetobacterium woodii DSM 1030]
MRCNRVCIPFLPLYICGTMINLTVSGEVFVVVGVLGEVFIIVVLLQFLDLLLRRRHQSKKPADIVEKSDSRLYYRHWNLIQRRDHSRESGM